MGKSSTQRENHLHPNNQPFKIQRHSHGFPPNPWARHFRKGRRHRTYENWSNHGVALAYYDRRRQVVHRTRYLDLAPVDPLNSRAIKFWWHYWGSKKHLKYPVITMLLIGVSWKLAYEWKKRSVERLKYRFMESACRAFVCSHYRCTLLSIP